MERPEAIASMTRNHLVAIELLSRPLILVAHPDDETLACGGLLQRVPASMVVFATDGTPGGYGLERTFGSLKAYTELRLQEGSRALGHIPNASFKWMTLTDGFYFSDQHVFEDLPDAAISLRAIAQAFAPEAIVSHAYEGAHIDHDACSFLAMHVAAALSLKRFEFPMYWLDKSGKAVLQQFRDISSSAAAGRSNGSLADVEELQLSEAEILCKNKMRAEYRTQQGTVSTFAPGTERFRLAVTNSSAFSLAQCPSYLFQERHPRFYHTYRHRLPARRLLKKFAEFEQWRLQRDDWSQQQEETYEQAIAPASPRRVQPL
jgi:LmbE family N-acetylglucosaminyl deacetylase